MFRNHCERSAMHVTRENCIRSHGLADRGKSSKGPSKIGGSSLMNEKNIQICCPRPLKFVRDDPDLSIIVLSSFSPARER